MFKVGEKVVFVMQPDAKPKDGTSIEDFNIPKQNDIVEIYSFYDETHVFLTGFMNKINGRKQAFHIRHLRKLDTDFATDVIAEIIKQVKEESLTLAN